jgi:hypothetical protein
MKTKSIKIRKNNKSIRLPGIFLNPQTKTDAKVLNDANDFYSQNNENSGIPNIDGFIVDVKDWAEIRANLNLGQTKLTDVRSLNDRILVIDTSLDFLLRGSVDDREKLKKLFLFEDDLINKVTEISERDNTPIEKSDAVVNEVYPMLDLKPIKDLIQFSLDSRSDILVRPTNSITSSKNIELQTKKAKEMISMSKILVSTLFSKYESSIDQMNLVTISAGLIEPRNYDMLGDLLLSSAPDQIGLKLLNLNNRNESQLRNILDFLLYIKHKIKMIDIKVPIHLMNVDVFGYVAYCYGVNNISMPIAVDPYYISRRRSNLIGAPPKGAYYHIQKRTHVQYGRLRMDCIKMDPQFKLPCYCAACESFDTILEVEKKTDWNYFRRLHEVLVRDIEISEIRNSPVPLHRSLQDMYARSFTSYGTLIPDIPLLDI